MSIEAKSADLSALKINRDIKTSSNGNKKYIYIGLLLLIIIGFWYVKQNTAITVKTIQIIESSGLGQDAVLTGQGYVVAQVKAAISSKATGRLQELFVIEGDKVKKGMIIGRIESNDVQANLNQQKTQIAVLNASLSNAQAELEDAHSAYLRQQSLLQNKVGTQSEFDASQGRWKRSLAQVSFAQAQINAQQAAIASAQVLVENTVIRAPFDGTVLSKNANVGEVITALGGAAGSRGAVVTLADMSSLEVEADVSESSLSKILPNMPVEISVSAIADKKYKGYVNKIIPTADRGKGTVQIKIRFNEIDERVLPEMGAKVNFLRQNIANEEQKPAKILIPTSSILTVNGKKTVFIVGAGSKATEQIIKTGAIFGEFTEVKQGLMSGTSLIISPIEKLSSGSSITIEKE
jgi:RND family efflux transporter MFP subunit